MIAAIIGPVATLIDDVVKRAFPDKTEQEKVQLALQTALLQADLSQLQAQIEVNKTEAGSNSIFVAGWRPAVGWSCAGCFAWSYVLQPLAEFAFAAAGHPVALPKLDLSGMMPVMTGMLGLAGLRSYEKINGKSNGH